MKGKKGKCETDNCIETPSSCVTWNGGSVEFLGICNGDPINNLIWEIITKLQSITEDDLSSFDIDDALSICSQRAPLEVNLINILNILKQNDICLKQYILNLEELVKDISTQQGVNVNLKCLADFDNLGNMLSLTRDQFDQLLVDKICEYKTRISTLESNVNSLNIRVSALETNSPDGEAQISTCVNSNVLPVSQQVKNNSDKICEIIQSVGTAGNITTALAQTPASFNTIDFTSLPGWILNPANLAQNYNNLLIAFSNVLGRLVAIEDNCCAITCDDIKIGYLAYFTEDQSSIILEFTSGMGTFIPNGFADIGSTITITDIDGSIITYTTVDPNLIALNAELEIPISGLNLNGDLTININTKISNDELTCVKCLPSKKVTPTGCGFCELTASGNVTIIYKTCTTTAL
jgi:hypothetical protein